MWTSKNRARYKRDHLRYPSDVTDEEWAHIGPLIPPAKRGGRKREVEARDVVDGIMYVLSTGCQWRYIPKDLPPRSTVYRYFCLWGYDGTLDRIHYALYEKCREQAGREASPTAAIIDSQSVKSAQKGVRLIVRKYLHPVAQRRLMHIQIARGLHIRQPAFPDQLDSLKFELACKLPPFHDPYLDGPLLARGFGQYLIRSLAFICPAFCRART